MIKKNLLSIGFFEVLAAVFITLKLTKVIDWSWWLVLAPLWGQLVIFDIIFVILGIVTYITYNKKKEDEREIIDSINDMTSRLNKINKAMRKWTGLNPER